jgi:hypothetical protein
LKGGVQKAYENYIFFIYINTFCISFPFRLNSFFFTFLKFVLLLFLLDLFFNMSKNDSNRKQKTPLLTHLVAGGAAGFMESCTCHPLDTIKVRMQLAKSTARSASVNKQPLQTL